MTFSPHRMYPKLATTNQIRTLKKMTACRNFSRCKEIPDFPRPALFFTASMAEVGGSLCPGSARVPSISRKITFAHIFLKFLCSVKSIPHLSNYISRIESCKLAFYINLNAFHLFLYTFHSNILFHKHIYSERLSYSLQNFHTLCRLWYPDLPYIPFAADYHT